MLKVIEVYDKTYLTSDGIIRKKVAGVGINDAEYRVDVKEELPAINGKRKRKQIFLCNIYTTWKGMLGRCYGEKTQHKNYTDVTVCDEWFYFSNFKYWYDSQDIHNKMHKEVDKDLLYYRNKVYSPETCVLVEKDVNQFLVTCEGRRGDYPLGVSLDSRNGKLRARAWGETLKGKSDWLGYFKTVEDAHKAWQRSKIETGLYLYNKETDLRVKQGLLRVIIKLENDLNNNLITEDL